MFLIANEGFNRHIADLCKVVIVLPVLGMEMLLNASAIY